MATGTTITTINCSSISHHHHLTKSSSSSSPSVLSHRSTRNKKRSWVVRTESNVWKPAHKKPQHRHCPDCGGSGSEDCSHCEGRGRSNCVHLAVLPKGVWPKCIPLALDMEK
ncbi:hypothetical protein AQUCO_04400083v1 [Aquilegia coerulea]|uniref:Uncharacterized protein n=1 Tax=Aquilegia coerulea TaxID=218851 RepID=A0A2G5CN19_AQUCA|nr:hypothetical protein AQUCO_04400083v1 [Aquilegia coerulea]